MSMMERLNRGIRSAIPEILLGILLTVIGVLLYTSLPTNQGMLVFGDLTGFDNFTGFNPQWVESLYLYRVLDWGLAQLTNTYMAQNATFIISYLVPAIGSFYLLSTLGVGRYESSILAAIIATPVNPVIFLVMMGGGTGYGFWLMFVAFCVAFLIRARKSQSYRDYVVAGIFLALSAAPPLSFAGLLMDFPIVGVVLIYSLAVPNRLNWASSLRRLLTFTTTAAALCLPWIIPSLLNGASIVSNPRLHSVANQEVLANVVFTFRPFLPLSALAYGMGTYNVWNESTWLAAVLLIIVSGMIYAFIRRLPGREHFAVLSTIYLLISGILIGVNDGVLVPVYTILPLVDYLDSPIFFIWIQTLSFIVLAGAAYLLICNVPWSLWLSTLRRLSKHRAFASAPQVQSADSLTRRARPLLFKRLSSIVALGVIGGLVVSAGWAHVTESGSFLAEDQPYPQFAPSNFSGLTAWYDSLQDVPANSILSLPYTFAEYNKVEAFIPTSSLWLVPSLGSLQSGQYNVTVLRSTMSLLANGSSREFAQLIALQGVEYVILENSTGLISIFPSYLGPELYVPLSRIVAEFSQGRYLQLIDATGTFRMYRDALYDSLRTESTTLIAAIASRPSAGAVSSRELLGNVEFDNLSSWDTYLSSNVAGLGNGTVRMIVNSSSSVNYTLLSSLIPSTISPASLGTIVGNDSFTSTSFSQTFELSFSYETSSSLILSAYVYWYNSTSPSSFFSQFDQTSVATNVQGTGHIEANFSAPSSAIRVRLILSAGPSRPGESGSAFVRNITLYQHAIANDIDGNVSLETDFGNLLGNQSLAGASPIVIPGEWITTSPLCGVRNAVWGLVVPAVTLDVRLEPSLNLGDLMADLQSFGANCGRQQVALIIPVGVTAQSYVSIVTPSGHDLWTDSIPAGNDTIVIETSAVTLANASLNAASAALEFSFVGLFDLNGTGAPPAQIVVQQSVGILALTESETGFSLSRFFTGTPYLFSTLSNSPFRFEPLFVLGVAVSVAVTPRLPKSILSLTAAIRRRFRLE